MVELGSLCLGMIPGVGLRWLHVIFKGRQLLYYWETGTAEPPQWIKDHYKRLQEANHVVL